MEFGEYVERRRPALMRFATVLTCQAWLAEDLVSDVLGRAFERWERISRLDEPHAYVRRMVVNEYLSWRRRLARTSPRAELEDVGHGDGADERAERDAMIRRLANLPRRQRAAVVLRYYAGLPDAEIAAELGCRVTTVRSQISRALASLRVDLTANPHAYQETR
ncbi:RNA polymerase sigma-70 factor (sigma-E family) [Saccharothrix variisporea]|uniref:RNA polymerase sigma-70 factor (Sigma-E family) n=2 Tax=Saccharothrix variisporea TaxID=543527 RepID=A0A495XDT9_9PSEU|nr:SigE family RNA polymerase sigma factor [Saccharothrix variisporea]RKT71436.1 RNA polymerase sigma-70 factor (sigma-E family) [Saccharothrix variisporea]